jgi:DNA mismatch endonuclease (patch repair protein)
MDRSENMRRIRSEDMQPEMAVRRLLHQMGFRYRLHCRDLPGKPDIVFRRQRKVIFVHGCFWHQHEGCSDGRLPKSNVSYWGPKFARNKARDEQVLAELSSSGWDVLVLWECETKEMGSVETRLLQFLRG